MSRSMKRDSWEAWAVFVLALGVAISHAFANPPQVTQITSDYVRIDAGEAEGVTLGASGKIYRYKQIGAQETRIEVARVQVTRVLPMAAYLAVVDRGNNEIIKGDLVELPGVAPDQDAGDQVATAGGLLDQATRQFMENKLTSPTGDNAFETLSEVLAREPENEDAQSLLSDIAGQYVSWGESALARGDLSKARGHVTKALRVQPGQAGALGLQGRVEAQAQEAARAAEQAAQQARAAAKAQELAIALVRANDAVENGDAEAARTAIAQARALDASSPGIARAEEALRRLESEGLLNSIGVRLKRIPAGSFQMGSPSSEYKRDGDERQHRVTLSRAFFLGVTEVTQAQWRAVMGNNPSHFSGDDRPVEKVSWLDAVEFCNRLSWREELRPAYRISGDDVSWNESADGYRLPTEAEWEYACRAGTTTPFSFGQNITPNQVNYDGNHPYRSGLRARYRQRTVEAGSLPANDWGLHEMHGNVYEWCWDSYGSYPSNSVTDPTGPQSGSFRVLRGGSWFSNAWRCRSTNRANLTPDIRSYYLGFRLVRSAPKAPSASL